MKNLLAFVLSFTMVTGMMAQKQAVWSPASIDKIHPAKTAERLSFPKEFKLFSLDLLPLQQALFSVVNSRGAKHSTVISLPNAAGNLEQFEVFEASNFEPALQAQFPEIRAFSGVGITDKYATVKLSISPQGIQTMIFRTERANEYMEPYSADHTVYAVYTAQRNPNAGSWNCSTVDRKLVAELNGLAVTNSIASRSGGNLKTLRLAQSVTAEYSNYFGATSSAQVSLVLAAINNTLTRCNGVYEKDLALHLNLIANTTSVIYYNASTDPYSAGSTGSGGAWNGELQSTLTSVIGEANYDIGHLFGASGGGGNAGCIGCICTNGSKGSGFTSPGDGVPAGDNFDIDYVVHEVGHQLGANHTFSMSNEGTGVNKEPGSGITIMGYAGITNYDLAPHSIAYYHQASIAQIQANLATKTCAVTTTIANAAPVIAALTNYTIPKSTPFALTGSASDANGDPLTFSWEQNDNAASSQTNASSVASATKASGPNWISFSPATSPVRYFPKLSTILAGGLISGPLSGGDASANTEALSSVARTLNFRLTVRDNAPYSSVTPVSVGQSEFKDMVVTVSSTSGPFAVTAPNTAVSYTGGSTQNITWAVASTTATPVSCANVKISLSTDGGQTFPMVLAASTPNDGTESLVIPNTPSTTARIKIEAVGNIFFDICNTNFSITSGSSCGTPGGLSSTSITTSGATLSWTAVSGALSYDVDYKLNSASTWTNAATATSSTSVSISGLSASSLYDWRVRANCTSANSAYANAQFNTAATPTCGNPTNLTTTSITTTSASFNWTAVSGALNYDVDYKLNSASTWTNVATATASTTASAGGLTESTLYNWRVRANCASLSGAYVSANFTTASSTPTCGSVTGLISSVTTTSATVNWASLSGALNYDVDYKLNSSATWSNAATGTTALTFIINGLISSSLYDWRVRANCSGATGNYTGAQFTTATPPTSCVSAYEANETLATSASLAVNTTISAAIGTASDIDYYKFTTTATSNLSIVLSNLPADFDMYIYNAAGTQIGSSAGTTTSETVNLNSQAAGTYYIKVIGYNGANSTTVCYNLKATVTTVTSCISAYDNSTNGTISGAATIPFNTNITGLINPASDIDNYKIVITTVGTISITLSTLPADFDVKLLNSAGTQVAISQAGGTTSETINYTAAAGTYYIQVYGYSSAMSATVCYTLKAQLGTATKSGTSEFISKGVLKMYPNPATAQINFLLLGVETRNNNFRIVDAFGKIVMQDKMNGNIRSLNVSRLASGTYILMVEESGTWISSKFVKQ